MEPFFSVTTDERPHEAGLLRGDETVELLELDASSIRVASYLTQLPSKELLRKKLRTAAELARNRQEGAMPIQEK